MCLEPTIRVTLPWFELLHFIKLEIKHLNRQKLSIKLLTFISCLRYLLVIKTVCTCIMLGTNVGIPTSNYI